MKAKITPAKPHNITIIPPPILAILTPPIQYNKGERLLFIIHHIFDYFTTAERNNQVNNPLIL